MSVQNILIDVEPLNHHQRWERMAALGRQSVTDPGVAQALEELAQSSVHYERLLALMSAYGSRNADLITRLLTDRSGTLTSMAIRLAARFVPDATLASLMPDLPKQCRLNLARRLFEAGRAHVNDAADGELGPIGQRHLLPLTSETFIRNHLGAEHISGLDASQWAMLALRVPLLVQDILLRELDAVSQPSYQVQMAVVASLHRILKRAPSVGLPLLTRAVGRIPARLLPLAGYASRFPSEVAALIQSNANIRTEPLAVTTLRRLDVKTLCALAEADALPVLINVFAKLRADQRAALYQANGEAWRESSGALPLAYVRALPSDVRQAEARHAFALPRLASEPMVRLPYLSCLPFQEALTLAKPFLSQPEGELRAQAVSALVGTGRYAASSLSAILDFCLARENEQDPVRHAMLSALAELPPSRWESRHLPPFTALINAALRARDCSFQTMNAAVRWLMGMIVTRTQFVADTLPRLVERMGSIGNGCWESRMSDREMVRLVPHLLPLLDTWIARDRSRFALGLIFGFGCRARAVPQFAELLASLTRDHRGHIARSGLEAMLRIRFTAKAAELIPQLLAEDPSWIRVDAVCRHLNLHRQDMLTPFLQAHVYHGRFSSNVAILPAFDGGFTRWTAAQQQCYADSLLDLLTSSQKQSAWELYSAVGRYAAMPSVDLSPVADLARLDASDVALRDKALEALGRADAGRGVPALTQALGDARARVAIYALRRSLMSMATEPALDLLTRVPRDKVTVAKEVVRLVGELEGETVFTFLTRLEASGDLHPDVRIALLRAFRQHLDRPDVWNIFHAAATSDQPAVARATIRIPHAGLSPAGQQHLSTHLALLLAHSNAQVRRETLERLVAMPPGRGDASLYDALAGQLDGADHTLGQLAASALLGAYAVDRAQDLAARFASVRQAQSLAAIVKAYEQRKWAGSTDLETSAGVLVETLLARLWHPGLAIRLALSVLPPTGALAAVRRCEETGLLHPGVVDAALTALPAMASGRALHELRDVEVSLGSEAHPGMRRMGLGLLCELMEKGGWTDEARRRFAIYRGDDDRWVSDAADLVEIPEPVMKDPVNHW